MGTPSITTLRAAANNVLALPSETPVVAVEVAALASANVGAPISPAATVTELNTQIAGLVTQSPTELLSLKSEETLKQQYNQLGPKMTTAERLALTPAADSIVRVYDTTIGAPFYWNGTAWVRSATLPNTSTRKMVVCGSSVAAGASASSYANSYSGIWATQLAQYGVSVTNVAVGGTDTVYWIQNFYTTVAAESPDVVFIGLGLWNEGLGGAAVGAAKDAVYARWISNIARLATMAKEIGARVIIGGNYPNNNWTAVDYQYVKQSYNDLTEMGLQVVQFLGTVDNGSGSWRTGMFADALHPNNAGHAAMAGALSAGLFSRHETSVVPARYLATQGSGRGLYMATDPVNPMLRLGVDTNPYRSFTIGWRMRKQTGPFGVVVPLCFTDVSRLRNPVSEWRFTSNNADVITTTVVPDYLWHHYALGFDYFTNKVTLWIDGVNVGTSANGATTDLSQYIDGTSLMGRFDNLGFQVEGGISDVTLHRYRLRDDEVFQLANGNIPTASLDLYCGFTDPDDTLQQYGRPGNGGFGDSYLQIYNNTGNSGVSDRTQAGIQQFDGQLVAKGDGRVNPGFPKAVIAMQSTTKGLQVPRMTTAQRVAISPGAADTIMVFDTDLKKLFQWDESAWQALW